MTTEAQAAEISKLSNALIDKYEVSIVDNARSNPDKPFKIPADEINAVIKQAKDSNEAIRNEAFDDFVLKNGESKDTVTKNLKKKFDKDISFFIRKNIDDGVNRIHAATMARQILEPQRVEAIESAVLLSKSKNSTVSFSEMAASYALYNRDIAIDNGWLYYRYSTSKDDVVRDDHNEREGKVFVYGKERIADDVPGLAANCRCNAFELTEEEALAGEFFYPEDRPDPATSGSRENFKLSSIAMTDKFKLTAQGKELQIDVVGYIDEWDDNDFKSFKSRVTDVLSSDDDIVNIDVSSHGGYAFDGMAAYSWLNSLKNKVVVNVHGFAGSAATLFLAAANHVNAGKTDTILMHEAKTCACGTGADLISAGEETNTVTGQIAIAYAEKTGRTKEEMLAIMAKDQYISAEAAKEIGIVDEIRGAEITASYNAQSRKTKLESKEMKTVEELAQELSDLTSKFEAQKKEISDLTELLDASGKELKAEQSKLQVAESTVVDESELEEKIRKEVLAEVDEIDALKSEVVDVGLQANGKTTKEILASAIEQAGGTSEGLDSDGLKSVWASVKNMVSRKKSDGELTGLYSEESENVTNIYDRINQRNNKGAA